MVRIVGAIGAVRLDEARQAAIEDRIESALALGRHGELVGELRTLVESVAGLWGGCGASDVRLSESW